jgi:hypothetical protein
MSGSSYDLPPYVLTFYWTKSNAMGKGLADSKNDGEDSHSASISFG